MSLRTRVAALETEVRALLAEEQEGSELARFSAYYGRELELIQEQFLGPDGRSKKLWAAPRAIVSNLITRRLVTVRSCRKGAKTETGGDIVLAFSQTGPTIAVTTASGGRQVETGLWSRINAQFGRCRVPLRGECLNTQLKIAPEWYSLGFSTNDSTKFAGFHAGVDVPDDPDAPEPQKPEEIAEAIDRAAHEVKRRSNVKRLLLVFDEAAGIDQIIFDAAKGSLEGEHTYGLMLANPTREADEPHEFCRSHRPGSLWWRIKIAAKEADDPVDCDESFIVPYWLARAESLDRLYAPDDPLYRPHVLGQFFDGDVAGRVITYAILREGARDAKPDEPDNMVKRGPHIGFDTAAYGGDANVAALYVDGLKVSVDRWHSQDTIATWERMKMLRAHWSEQIGRPIPWHAVHIDKAPVAAGILDMARREGADLHAVDFGGEPTYFWREITGEVKFRNRRAELYWSLRELLKRRMACIPAKYERSWQELAAHSYTFTAGTDMLVLEPKEKVRERLGRSPDESDADVLAFANAPRLGFSRTDRV